MLLHWSKTFVLLDYFACGKLDETIGVDVIKALPGLHHG